MGRRYAVTIDAVAVSAQQDLFEVRAPAGVVCILHGIQLGQSSDAGDSEDEQLALTVKRSETAATGGSGGSSSTPTPLDPGDAASGATAEINNTTQITGGTPVDLAADAFNARAGYQWIPTPEMRPIWADQQYLTVGLETTPADALTISGTLVYEEIG